MDHFTAISGHYLGRLFYDYTKIYSSKSKFIISFVCLIQIKTFQTDQMTVGLRWLPLFYAITIMINVFSIIHSAPPSSFDLSIKYFE
jgi:hypothetical protein